LVDEVTQMLLSDLLRDQDNRNIRLLHQLLEEVFDQLAIGFLGIYLEKITCIHNEEVCFAFDVAFPDAGQKEACHGIFIPND
jgi:hypothetical protein